MRINGKGIGQALEAIGLPIGRKGHFGISRQTWINYTQRYADVTDETLYRMFVGIFDSGLSDVTQREVYDLFNEVYLSTFDMSEIGAFDLARGGSRTPPVNPLPKVSQLMIDRWPSGSSERHSFGNQLASGIKSYNEGKYDVARKFLEQAVSLRGNHLTARLYCAKAHLNARRGDFGGHWRSARRHLDAFRDLVADSPRELARWQFWDVVAMVRDPTRPDRPEKFESAAEKLQELVRVLETQEDLVGLNYARFQVAVCRFRSGVPNNQEQAIVDLSKILRTPSDYLSKYQRALGHKLLGNFYTYSGPTAESFSAADLHHSTAEDILSKMARMVEWAQVRYSRGDALLKRARYLLTQSPELKSGAMAAFLDAEAACKDAIANLSQAYPEDRARAQWNLGECYIHWPTDDKKIVRLQKAYSLFMRVLNAFPRDYIFSEWQETHEAISATCAEILRLLGHNCVWLSRSVASIKAVCLARIEEAERQIASEALKVSCGLAPVADPSDPGRSLSKYHERLQAGRVDYERQRCNDCKLFDAIAASPK